MKRNTSSSVDQTEDDLRPIPNDQTDSWADPNVKDPLSKAQRPQQPKARKDTRRWCKGKVGREHVLTIELDPRLSWAKEGCRWVPYWVWSRKGGGHRERRTRYACHHHEVCTVCGKRMRDGWDFAPEDCPDFHLLEGGSLDGG